MSMVELSATEQKIAARIDSGAATQFEVSNSVGGLGFSNMGQALEFAKMMALASVAVPKHLRGNPGACLAVIIQAVEWRLSPYAVANKSYSVNDRLAYESQLIQAVILQRAPIDGRFKVEFTGEGDNRVCRIWAKLRGSDETVDYESPKFGRITPKNSPLWKSDPDQQHFYYSGRALCRRHFPDVLLGVYADDEIAPGAENARDVTPPKTISAKLDALAATASSSAAGSAEGAAAETGAQTASSGDATEESTTDAPAADQASPQSTSPVGAASGQAALENAQDPSQPAQSGAATAAEWPEGKTPTNAAEYTACTKAWLAQVSAGATSPEDARARWKGEMKLRNACGVDESVRDPLKEELDGIVAAVKKAA